MYHQMELAYFHEKVVPTLLKLGSFGQYFETLPEFYDLLNSLGFPHSSLPTLYQLVEKEAGSGGWVDDPLPSFKKAFSLSKDLGKSSEELEGVLYARIVKVDRQAYIDTIHRFLIDKKMNGPRFSPEIVRNLEKKITTVQDGFLDWDHVHLVYISYTSMSLNARNSAERRFVKRHGNLGSLQRYLQDQMKELEVRSLPIMWFDPSKEEELVKAMLMERILIAMIGLENLSNIIEGGKGEAPKVREAQTKSNLEPELPLHVVTNDSKRWEEAHWNDLDTPTQSDRDYIEAERLRFRIRC